MTIQEGLVTHLEADANVTAIVSDRIYPLKFPQSPTLPAIRFFMVADERIMAHDGLCPVAQPLVQIESWAQSYATALSLADTVRDSLAGFIGNMGTVAVRGVDPGNQIDFWEDEPSAYRVVQDYTFRYLDT